MKTLVNLLDTTNDLAGATADLLEATETLEATWDVLGDGRAYVGLSDEQAVIQWERDLMHAGWQEAWVRGYVRQVQQRLDQANKSWTNLVTVD